MFPYFLIMGVSALPAILIRNRVNPTVYWSACLIMIAFIGMRYRVGMDWGNYEYIHQAVSADQITDLLFETEPASYVLFWISMYLNEDMLFTNIVAAIILCFGVFSFAMRTANPWLAVLSATPYLIIAFGMTGIRQAMGIGVIMFLLANWSNYSFVKRCAFVFGASLFHTSALIVGIMVIFQMKASIFQRLAILVVGGLFAYFFFFQLLTYQANIEFYQDTYLSGEDSIVSPGALLHVALVWIPAIAYLVLRKHLTPFVHDIRLLDFGAVATIAVLILYFVSSTAASRMTLYLYFVPMMVYPAIASLFGERNRVMMTTLIVIFQFGVLLAWLVLANNSIAHIPYRSVFFADDELF